VVDDTPRTDREVQFNLHEDNLVAHNRMLDHARELERELTEAHNCLSEAVQSRDHHAGAYCDLERELARYKRLEAILRDRSDVNYEGDGPNEAMSILTEWEGLK
jgi:hypothetical protein